MTIKFKSITIHHFMSFDHATIDLTERGYCLVRGINRNPKDRARSNGSGKSTVFNAISYCLVGETLQGLRSGLPNVAFDDGCYVSLEFSVDGHDYELTRSKDDPRFGTDLKIKVDGEGRSGKGIRESQAILDQLLPELTSELLGSVIMIGQGMPMRFTANTPSGRKEVLEHLSRSDFMIQDLKDRVSKRLQELLSSMQGHDARILALNSNKDLLEKRLASLTSTYETDYANQPSFPERIATMETELSQVTTRLGDIDARMTSLNSEIGGLGSRLEAMVSKKESLLKQLDEARKPFLAETGKRRSDLVGRKCALESEIKRLKSIRDVCPTCGQKIPGAIKPDTTEAEASLAKCLSELEGLESEMAGESDEYMVAMHKVHDQFEEASASIKADVGRLSSGLRSLQEEASGLNARKQELVSTISSERAKMESFEKEKARILSEIGSLRSDLASIETDIGKETQARHDDVEHHDTVTKMVTMLKRDFRGVLLGGIIDYIGARSKEYASKIFGCDEVGFCLNGNDIDITFCGKDYSSLSGGEQQRVNLIVQFALRDFMCKYLGFSSNILVLDEITDALDAESCNMVIGFITNELKDIESVFIISHHDDSLELPCDSTLTIEKNAMGVSSVIQ